MHLVLISGSHRQNSQSLRVSKYLAERISKLDHNFTTDILEMTGNPLPLWDEGMWQAGSDLQKIWEPYKKRLQAADGYIVISPEWSGMVPSGLKTFFLYCSSHDIGHKPAMIVGVSASRGGAYPVDELRISSYKNTMLCYIPEHLIIRDVTKVFLSDTPSDKDDEYIRGRADFSLKVLFAYTKAMKPMRDNGDLFDKKYPFGM